MILSCPACAAQVKFHSPISTFGVCEYCQSTLVRHDEMIHSIGKMAQLSPDLSPVQLGTCGRWSKNRFTIIGCKKMAWEHGLWNEWHILFDSARTGWLAEAQGQWAISLRDQSFAPPEVKDLIVGGVYQLGKKKYLLDDIKNASCRGSMGELPMKALKGDQFISANFTGDNLSFASVDYGETNPVAYLGEYLEFDDFQFTHLRHIDGW